MIPAEANLGGRNGVYHADGSVEAVRAAGDGGVSAWCIREGAKAVDAGSDTRPWMAGRDEEWATVLYIGAIGVLGT